MEANVIRPVFFVRVSPRGHMLRMLIDARESCKIEDRYRVDISDRKMSRSPHKVYFSISIMLMDVEVFNECMYLNFITEESIVCRNR